MKLLKNVEVRPKMAEPAAPPLAAAAVLALLTIVTLELIRTTAPLLEPAFGVGVLTAAGTAIATYLGAGLFGVWLIRVTMGADRPTVLLVGVIMLTAARLLVQGLTGDPRFLAGMVTIAIALAVLTLAVSLTAGRPGGGRSAAGAIATGAAASVGIQLALGTWDAFWRHDRIGWTVTTVLLASLVVCATLAWRSDATAAVLRAPRLWALGPALGLTFMMLGNPAFASSQADIRLVVAGPITALGLLLAGVFVLGPTSDGLRQQFQSTRLATPIMVGIPAAAIAGLLWASGLVVLAFLFVAQLAVFAVLSDALEPSTRAHPADPSPMRVAGSASLVGLGTILPLLLFQLDYKIPLGFPNELVIVAAALLLGTAVLHRDARGLRTSHSAAPVHSERWETAKPALGLLVAASVIALVGSLIAIVQTDITGQRTDAAAAAGSFTLVSWNLHYGVDPTGDLDLEQIAGSIEEQNPSVVILQEVSRGWTTGGGADMATWLADRLEMTLVGFAPAADRQFGNAILTNLPTENTSSVALPYGQGPQNRSALSTDLVVEGGPIRITSIHLQNDDDHTPTRLNQLQTFLQAEGDATIAIVAGDFNAQPGWPEINLMTTAGLVSAQDVAGDPSALTDPSTNPVKRIDWIFGRGVLFTETVVLSEALSSDHLPLVATFTLETSNSG